jgi:hypothetical protein
LTVAALAISSVPAFGQPNSAASPRFPIVGNDDAWQQLTPARPALPAWARTLIVSLPRTTGGMLELDSLHRAKNPLGPVLAGKLRWAAADTIGCAYSRQSAEADLKRASISDSDLKHWKAGRRLPPADRLAREFARKLTEAAYTVTDDEFARLVEHFGANRVVAMVHTLALANFQNRIFLALGVDAEPGGPLPPFDVPLDAQKRMQISPPERPPLPEIKDALAAISPPAWRAIAFDELQTTLESQKNRKGRLQAPPLPPGAPPTKIVWTQVSAGHQMAMTKAWFDCMQTYYSESKIDRVFANSVFWVVTRSNECFY